MLNCIKRVPTHQDGCLGDAFVLTRDSAMQNCFWGRKKCLMHFAVTQLGRVILASISIAAVINFIKLKTAFAKLKCFRFLDFFH